MDKINTITIWWKDALLYERKISDKMNLKPTLMMTRGVLVKKNNEGLFIANPQTIYRKTGNRVSKEKGAAFLFIPHGMIEKAKEK